MLKKLAKAIVPQVVRTRLRAAQRQRELARRPVLGRDDLLRNLDRMGVARGDTVFLHSGFSNLNLRLSIKEVAELLLARLGADVLGVDRRTVGRDKRADAHPEPDPAAQPEGLERADAHPEPDPGQTSLMDVLADATEEADEELADLFTSDDDRARNAFRRALGELTTAQARIVEFHDRWTPEQRREIDAALTLARRDLKIATGKLEVVR